ncbi:hypothetical protein AAG906_005949 [Vitis piasezkii]
MVGNQEAQHGFDKNRVKEMFGFEQLEEMRNDAYINSKIAKERLKKWHDQLSRENREKQRKTRRKAKTQNFALLNSECEIAPPYPLCEIAFVGSLSIRVPY